MWRFEAIGTVWEIDSERELPLARRRAVAQLIQRFDLEWSRFRGDSVVAALARGETVGPPADTEFFMRIFRDLHEATAGGVSPWVGARLAELGYGPEHGENRWKPRTDPKWVRTKAGLSLSPPGLFDVGAVGKGRLVDLVLAELDNESVTVDASGDLRTRGEAITVALEHPFDPPAAIGTVVLQNEALCASATNRRVWGRGLHHVLDAKTGNPVRTIVATWVIMPNAARADALATALFFPGTDEFPGSERLASEWGAEWVRMSSDGRVDWSPGCRATLFRSVSGDGRQRGGGVSP